MRNAAFAAVFGAVISLGLPLNSASLWILLGRHGIQSPSAVFMVNLVLSDLMLIVALPLRVYYYATDDGINNLLCVFFTMLFRNNIRSSSIFITFISVDRLLAVVYPLRWRHIRSATNAWRGAALVWTAVVLVNIPEGWSFTKNLKDMNESACIDFSPSGKNKSAEGTDKQHLERSDVDYFQLVLMFSMLAINIISTAMVSWTLKSRLKESAMVENKVNVMLIFAMNLMMFTVFFIPVSLVVFFEDWRPILSCLASVNCCMDPLLYFFSFDGFWKRKEDVDTSLTRP